MLGTKAMARIRFRIVERPLREADLVFNNALKALPATCSVWAPNPCPTRPHRIEPTLRGEAIQLREHESIRRLVAVRGGTRGSRVSRPAS